MSLESEVRTVLLTVCPRVYRSVVRVAPVYPLVIYQQVGGRAINFTDKTVPDKSRPRVQVWGWSKSPIEASQLAADVRRALVTSPLQAVMLVDPVDDYNEALELFGVRTDYEVVITPGAT